jgi:hypothetical protein
MKSILAIITQVSVSDGVPTHPIVIPPGSELPPLDIWGGKPPPFVDIGGPGAQPKPEHPIVLPPDGPPLVIWGGAPLPHPGHPIAPGGTPPKPAHPIVIPPDAQPVPPGIWGGGNVPFPEHPIVIPPGVDLPEKFTVIVYHEESGKWVAIDFVPGGKPPSSAGPKR